MESLSSSLDGFPKNLGISSSYEIDTRNGNNNNGANHGLCTLKEQTTHHIKSVSKNTWDTSIMNEATTDNGREGEYNKGSLLLTDGVRLSYPSPQTSCLVEESLSCLSPDVVPPWLVDNLGDSMKRQETLLVVEEMIGEEIDHVLTTAECDEEEFIERQRRELGMIYRNPQLRTQRLISDMDDTRMVSRMDTGLTPRKPQLKILIPSETTLNRTTVWPGTHEKTNFHEAHGSTIMAGLDDRSAQDRGDGNGLLLVGSVDNGSIGFDSHNNCDNNRTRMASTGSTQQFLTGSHSFTMLEGQYGSDIYGESMMEGRPDCRTSIHRSSGPRMARSQSMIVHKGKGESRENPDDAGRDNDRAYRGSSSWFRTTRDEMPYWLPPSPLNQSYHEGNADDRRSGQHFSLAYARVPDRCTPSNHGMYPALILPYLYLGNDEHASNVHVLRHLAIAYIVNCAIECDNHFEHVPSMPLIYHNVRLKHDSENIQEFFESTFEFIDRAMDEKRAVLIHCFFGQSRSAVIVMAYLMKKLRLSFHKAYELVRMACPCINPHHILLFQLSEFERRLVNSTCSPTPSLPSSTSLLNSDSR